VEVRFVDGVLSKGTYRCWLGGRGRRCCRLGAQIGFDFPQPIQEIADAHFGFLDASVESGDRDEQDDESDEEESGHKRGALLRRRWMNLFLPRSRAKGAEVRWLVMLMMCMIINSKVPGS
jgi:hypothetical protein